MGKTLTYKSGYYTSDIINRSDVGDLLDNGDGTIDATNVNTTDVRNVLGESTNNVGLLCKSSKINMWALFKPGYIDYDANNNLIFKQPTDSDGYKLGDFLGYNHSAGKPEVPDISVDYGEDESIITIHVLFNQFEVNWAEMGDVSHFYVRIMEGTTEREKKSYQIDYTNRSQMLDIDLDVSQNSGDKTLTVEVWVGNSAGKQAKVNSGTLSLNYLELTEFLGIPQNIGSDYTSDWYTSDWDDMSFNTSDDTFTIDIYMYDSNGDRVTKTVDIDVMVNGSLDHTIYDVTLSKNHSGGTSVSDGFYGGINKYGDTWGLELVY